MFIKGQVGAFKGRKHSAETKKLMSRPAWNKGIPNLENRGENHWRWKGGEYKHNRGYIMALAHDHPYATKEGYILKHRLVYEKAHNITLLPSAVIHHINEDKTDNRVKEVRLKCR